MTVLVTSTSERTTDHFNWCSVVNSSLRTDFTCT